MTELTYTKVGDYYIPDLKLDGQGEREKMPLGKYGRLRERFLQEHHHGTYTSMLLTGRLEPHLRETDRQAREQVDRMVDELKKPPRCQHRRCGLHHCLRPQLPR